MTDTSPTPSLVQLVPVFTTPEFEAAANRVGNLTGLGSESLAATNEGVPVNADTANWCIQVLGVLEALNQPCPAVFPTKDGALSSEWTIGDIELVWELGFGDHFVQSVPIGTTDYTAHEVGNPLPFDLAVKLEEIITGIAANQP